MSTTTNLHPMGSLRLTGGNLPGAGYDMTPRLDMRKSGISRGSVQTKVEFERPKPAAKAKPQAPKKKGFLADWRPFFSGAW
jgi:hypothetical protein